MPFDRTAAASAPLTGTVTSTGRWKRSRRCSTRIIIGIIAGSITVAEGERMLWINVTAVMQARRRPSYDGISEVLETGLAPGGLHV
jgi:hypothetical protein